jgi:hypothetical protein
MATLWGTLKTGLDFKASGLMLREYRHVLNQPWQG